MKVSGKLGEWVVFVEVAEAKSFTQAAQNMNISVSSVSKQISRLEEGLNSQLINRDTHNFELTDAGMLAYERATVIIEMMNDLMHNLRNPAGNIEGAIKLTAPAIVCEFLANFWLDEYIAKNKGVSVFMESRESSQFTKESSAFDHLVLKSGIIESDDLIHRELSPLKLSLCASREYIEREGEPSHPSELHNHKVLQLYHHGLSSALNFHKEGEVYSYNNTQASGLSTDNFLGNFNLMVRGRGISLATSGFLSRHRSSYPGVVTILSEWEIPPVPVYLVWRQRKFYSPLFRDFIGFITEKWNNRDRVV